MNNKTLGNLGEDAAAAHLIKLGHKILERNYRIKSGEIDIISYDGEYICFTEVKTRRDFSYGAPIEAVNYKKQQKILSTARIYMQINEFDKPMRFDVAEVLTKDGVPKMIRITKNAFGE